MGLVAELQAFSPPDSGLELCSPAFNPPTTCCAHKEPEAQEGCLAHLRSHRDGRERDLELGGRAELQGREGHRRESGQPSVRRPVRGRGGTQRLRRPALPSARRAPVLVALALIESGMKYEDAIQFIRQ